MTKSELKKNIFGSILILTAVFFSVSLVSFQVNDLPFFRHPPSDTLSNLCGIFGARSAYFMLDVAGFASFIIIFAMAVFGLLLVLGREIERAHLKIAGAILLAIGVSGFLGMLDSDAMMSRLGTRSAGGVTGFYIYRKLFTLFGVIGTYILLGSVIIVSLILCFESRFTRFVETCLKLIKNAVSGTAGSVSEAAGSYREKRKEQAAVRAEMRAEKKAAEKKEKAEKAEKARQKRKDAEKKKAEKKKKAALKRVKDDDAIPDTSQNTDTDSRPVSERIHEDVSKGKDKYELPPPTLLDESEDFRGVPDQDMSIEERGQLIIDTLADFEISAELVSNEVGPTITQFEISIGRGIKVHRIMNLSDNIAMAMKASSIRIVAPIPGKSTIGIEVPNMEKKLVSLRGIVESRDFKKKDYTLPLILGRTSRGDPLVADITRMPHLLIAGATGSGKSVCINSIITSIMMFCRPDRVKLLMIDPKMVEMQGYKGIPHCLSEPVTDMKTAALVFEKAVKKMDDRYRWLEFMGVRNIAQYNKMSKSSIVDRIRKRESNDAVIDMTEIEHPMPYIIIIVDELADLMMISSKEVEDSIIRLSQKSRAVGIHIVLATQRPSVNVITGLIKSNMPARVSFQVSSKVDSRTILDKNGAETLIGQGDMLYLPPTDSKLIRAQGVYVSDEEIERVVEFIKAQRKPDYSDELSSPHKPIVSTEPEDELFDQAVRVVLESERGSASLLQRRLAVGYTRASRLIEIMEEQGILGPHKGSQARELLMTLEEWESTE